MSVLLGKVILITAPTMKVIQTQVQVKLDLGTEIDHQDRIGNAPLAGFPTFLPELLASNAGHPWVRVAVLPLST